MPTLTVTVSTDYRVPPFNAQVIGQNIAGVQFSGSGALFATFGSDQFGGANISNFLSLFGRLGSDDIIIVEMAAAGTFSAADWSFNDWTPGLSDDRVDIAGTAGNDSITGASVATFFTGGGGRDTLNGGAGNDWFSFETADVVSGEIINGNGGNDLINVGAGRTVDFSVATVSSIEAVSLGQTVQATFASDVFGAGAGKITSVTGNAGVQILKAVGGAGSTVIDLSGVSFSTWNSGEDFVYISGRQSNDTLTGTGVSDYLTGDESGVTASNDVIDGAAGTDYAGYANARSSYAVFTYSTGGAVTTRVTNVGGAADGVDTLTNVEGLYFNGVLHKLAGAQLNRISNVSASRYDDVVFHNTATGQSYGYLMNAGAVSANGALSAALGFNQQAVDTGDINGDGRGDLVYQNLSTGFITLGLMTGAGLGTQTVISNSLSTAWRLVGMQDVDGDAWLDLVVQNNTTGQVSVGDLTGTNFNGWTTVSGQGTFWQARALGDVNGDGRADIIYQSTSSGVIAAGLMASNGTISSYMTLTGAETASWTLRDSADVNRDGYADVLIQSNINGDISYVNMANGLPTSYGTIMNGFGTAWRLDGVADTNNDGDFDAIVRNILGSGDTYVVNTEGGNFQSFTLVAQGIGSSWYVV